MSPRRSSGEAHHGIGHPQQRIDRRGSGSITVPGGISRRQHRRPSGQSEIVQRGQDYLRPPLTRRHRPDGAERVIGLTQGDSDALVQRRYFGRIDLTEMPVRLSERPHTASGRRASCGRPFHPGHFSHSNGPEGAGAWGAISCLRPL